MNNKRECIIIITIIIAVIVSLILWYTRDTIAESTQLPVEDDWGITLTLKNVTSTGLTIVCEQEGTKHQGDLGVGADYLLSKYENGVWVDFEQPVWALIGYGLDENDITEWEIDWENLYGSLEKGEYKIGKPITDTFFGSSVTQIYYVTFEIK